MATVSLTIPDAKLAEVLSAFQASYPGDWTAAQAAGLTGAQFCKQKVAEYVKSISSATRPSRCRISACGILGYHRICEY